VKNRFQNLPFKFNLQRYIEDELRQPTFAIGLKGVSTEDIPKVEKLIFDTIAKIAEVGLCTFRCS
jgi:Zn-dependent M16 (insulinase) family peptidase